MLCSTLPYPALHCSLGTLRYCTIRCKLYYAILLHNLVPEYPTFKLFGFLSFNSNLKVYLFPWLIGEVKQSHILMVKALPLRTLKLWELWYIPYYG